MARSALQKPIIRWAGSKRKLVPLLKEHLPREFNTYIEPFCGSACLFFSSNFHKGILSDINFDLINALEQIKTNPEIHSLVTSIPNTEKEYYRQRSLDPDTLSDENRATRFLYLNRYCFNGVYRTNKQGKFNVPRGVKTGDFPCKEEFETARKKLQYTELVVSDYKDTLNSAFKNDFVYMDPPYTPKGKFTGEYGLNSFNSESMEDLINCMLDLDHQGINFLFSYRYDEEISKLMPPQFNMIKIPVKRHVSGFKKSWQESNEILVKNYE